MKHQYTILFIILFLIFVQSSTFSQGIPAREESNLDQVSSEYGLTGEGVVIAIIDRGIDYTHADFIDENGKTRLLYLYDMINPAGANDPDNPYGIGTIFDEAEINAALETDGPLLSMDRYGHGIATTGIAAGNGSGGNYPDFVGVAPKAKLIIVKAAQDYFPPFDQEPGQDGFYNPTYIPVALQFIADKAPDMPVVALLNMGSVGGPTDGSSTIARAMTDFVDSGHTLVCGVGDDGGADNHASAFLAQDQTIELTIQKGEAGNLRFDLWYSEDDRYEVTLTRPDNTTEGPFQAPATANDKDDRFLTGINYYHRGANLDFAGATSNRRQLMIDFTSGTGTFKVSLKATTVGSQEDFHATLNPSTDKNNNKFTSHVVNGYALNDFTAAYKVISPTDYVVKNNYTDMDGINREFNGQGNPGELWTGSSWGPTQDGRMKVDFAACGELLYAAYSPGTWYSHYPHLLVQGGDNHYGIQNAVSAAAPLTTGVIALLLEMRPDLTYQEIQTILRETAREDSFTGTVPNNKWGYGKLDAYKAAQVTETLGTGEINDQESVFSVFPNPARDEINISILRKPLKIEKLYITNLLGQRVLEVNATEDGNQRINISQLPKGMYQLTLQGADQTYSAKFLK